MSRKQKGYIVLISGVLILIALSVKSIELTVSNILMIVAGVIAGYPIAKQAIQSLLLKIIGIELLVTIAVIGAFLIQEYWEAAAVTFLFIFGSYLESRTLEKTRSSIKSLLDLAPEKATVIRDGKHMEVTPDEVRVGETVIIRPGEKIPVDGSVLRGSATVNQASITGESKLVHKEGSDTVYSGTLLDTGYLYIQAEKVGEETTFAKILELVEEAQDHKIKTQVFFEKFATYYTPSILLLAIIIYFITKDHELTLTLLVISCPGALVISTPVSVVAGIGNAAKNGILFKGGEQLEKIGKVDVVAFDKTGTLTIGQPQVTNITTYQIAEEALLELVQRAELHSEHHLAKAILNKGNNKNTLKEAEAFENIPGKGIRAIVDSTQVWVGNRALLEDIGVMIPQKVEQHLLYEENRGQTVVIVANGKSILGTISIADQVREEAYDIVRKLKANGVKKVVMLTGDNKRTAELIAGEIGIDATYADLLPEQKVDVLKRIQKEGHTVAMVGDGVNDAPGLASADIGIAMGGVGTDVAMDTAGVVLMSGRLNKLAHSFYISKKTVNNLKQNTIFAVTVVLLLILGVLGKKVFLASGMLIHELSVLIVILNALRLVKMKRKHMPYQQPKRRLECKVCAVK